MNSTYEKSLSPYYVSTSTMTQQSSLSPAALVIGAALMLGSGTASAEPFEKEDPRLIPIHHEQTTTGGYVRPMTQAPIVAPQAAPLAAAQAEAQVEAPDLAQPTRKAVAELRRLTGLTWEKLAELFGVSRRSVHLWASGNAMTEGHETHLRQALAAVQRIDRGRTAANKGLLLTPHDGESPFALLKSKNYDRFVELLGERPGRERPALTPLSQEAKDQRKPLPPATLIAAQDDVTPVKPGRLRSAKPLRSRSREE